MNTLAKKVQSYSGTVLVCSQRDWRQKCRIKCVDTPLPFINFIEELQCLRSQLAITALEHCKYCKYELVVDVSFPRCSWE